MNFRPFVISLVIALPLSAHAQDKIYKRDGSTIDVKIKSVDARSITYLRFDNQSGPEYVVSKNDVEKIAYQNGTTDVFDESPHRHRSNVAANSTPATGKTSYRPHILSLAPLQFTENGLGAGLSYECTLDQNGIIAFYVPVILTENHNTTHDPYNNTTMSGRNDVMFYAMPGIKIYPTSSTGIVKFAVGPSLVVATGQKSTEKYDPIGVVSSYYYVQQTNTLLGVVVNNSVNINPTKRIYLGLEFGFGFTYVDLLDGVTQGTKGIVQGSFKVGYRF